MKKYLVLVLVMVMVSVISGTCLGAADYSSKTIRCGVTTSETSLTTRALRVFELYVETASNGRLQFELFGNATLGNERDMAEGLTMGTLEMVTLSTAPLINFSPDFMVWDLPFIVVNTREGLQKAYDVMDSEIGQAMLDSLLSKGIKGLAFVHNGFRCTQNRKLDVKTVADMKGLKIRTMENEMHLAYYQAVGANPTPMASAEAVTALQQGVIDGMDTILDYLYTSGSWEIGKNITVTGHVFSSSAMIMADKFFKSLSPEDQQIVLDATEVTKKLWRDIAESRENEVIELLRDAGATVTRVDIAEWRPLVSGIWDKYSSKIEPKYLDALTK